MITESQAIAAMKRLEEETIQRCAAVIRAYANTKNDVDGRPSSRMAATKQMAAHELVTKILALPRKSA
jgi:hypothetical protein